MCTVRSVQRSRPFDLATTSMVAREIRDGVFAVIPAGSEGEDQTPTNAGFIVGSKAVLVVDPLISGRLAAQVIGEIRKRSDLPIRYVVDTSWHGDHSFGNYVFPAEAIVIAHPYSRAYLKEHFDSEKRGTIEFVGAGFGIEDVMLRLPDLCISHDATIDLGGVEVLIRFIGHIQTDGDLAIEANGVVFVGNAVAAPRPAIQWQPDARLDESLAATERFRDSIGDDTIIVPGHGRPMRRAEMDYQIGYVRQLRLVVRKSVEAGNDLAATLELAAMEEYSEYSVYELAHLRTNVPAAYAEATLELRRG